VSTGAPTASNLRDEQNCEVKNNLVIAGSGDALLVARDSVAGTVLANNNYRNTSGMMISYNGTSYSARSSRRTSRPAATAPRAARTAVHGRGATKAVDIQLQPGSPMINAGVLIPRPEPRLLRVTAPEAPRRTSGLLNYEADVPPRAPSRLRSTQ